MTDAQLGFNLLVNGESIAASCGYTRMDFYQQVETLIMEKLIEGCTVQIKEEGRP